MYIVSSANKDNFISFPICNLLISFFYFIAPATALNTTLKKMCKGTVDSPVSFLDLNGIFLLSPKYWLWVCHVPLWCWALFTPVLLSRTFPLRHAGFCHRLLLDLLIWLCNFSVFNCIYIIWYISWLTYDEPSLHIQLA